MLALFLDLEHKLHVWRLYVTFELRSPMSWGSWILILVYPVLAASALVRLPEPLFDLLPGLRRLSGRLARRPERVRALGLLSMALGAALGVYTGILLSSLGARPLWSSGLLPPLFLFSGLSTGAAFGHLVARDPEESVQLARADNAFLATELALIGLLLIGLTSATEAHSRAAALLLGGPFTAVFWVGVVGLGILVPLLIQSLAVRHHIAHTPVAPVLVMLGGLLLRIVIVYAGQASRWPQT
jgi:formate-dependent nitrite reductase membrane component NrfD